MQTSFPGYDHVAQAIETCRIFEPTALKWNPRGYWLAFSGGKDSIVLYDIAVRAGVKFNPVYNVTTIDPPELTRFIRAEYPQVEWHRLQKIGMIEMAASSKGLPTRLVRWCCEKYKHTAGEDWCKLLGVRSAESAKRKGLWRTVLPGQKPGDGPAVNPILNWSDSDVWDYIRERKLKYCKLYDEGFKRLGCIGCPIAGEGRKLEFARWPNHEKMWRSAARRYWAKHQDKLNSKGKPYYCSRFKSGDEFFEWWMSDNPTPREEGQCEFGMA